MLKFTPETWIRIVVFNLITVAVLGVTMRYKIGFEFPYFDQKHLQLAHSNFAFTGWVTQTILVLIVAMVQQQLSLVQLKKYNVVLWLNLFCAYGLLIAFFIQGYGFFSIAFSILSILVMLVFTYMFFKHSKQFIQIVQAIKWFKAAFIFAVLSSAGTIVLAYVMLNHHIHQNTYLASVYFYLHFQYNGWFLFSCIALFIGLANKNTITIYKEKTAFHLIFWSCIPAYFLSTLWANIPMWLYSIVVLAAIAQMAGWFVILWSTFRHIFSSKITNRVTLFLVYYVTAACTIKFLLQLGSTIPLISKLAFGFRPIVIAYLHLVLLAVISMMLILYMYCAKYLIQAKWSVSAIIAFSLSILLNESVLAIQGIASFSYTMIPYTNLTLFIIALLLFFSALWIFITQFTRNSKA